MRRQLPLILGLLFGLGASLAAQTTPEIATDMMVVFRQKAPSLAEVQTYRFTGALNGGTPAVLTNVVCPPGQTPDANGFQCYLPNPGQTDGVHTLVITAAAPLNTGGFTAESPTATCVWRTKLAPTAPSNFSFGRLIKGVIVSIFNALKGVFT